MKKNFNIVVKNIDGGDMLEQENKPLTMKAVCLTALLLPQNGDDNLDGKKKCDLVSLAIKINADEEVDVSTEEIVVLKQRIAKVPFTNHMIVFRSHEFLEGE